MNWGPEWMRRGACVDHPDPDLWFPPRGYNTGLPAKAICVDCPVRVECLDYARAERIDHGIWGGLTATERCGRGRPRTAINHGTYNGYRIHLYRKEKPCAACARAATTYDKNRKATA